MYSWVDIGTKYKIGMVIAIHYTEDLPVFGLIMHIFSHQNRIYFIILSYTTVGFNDHLHCYEVKKGFQWFCLLKENFLSHYPTIVRHGHDGRQYISFQHFL